MGNLNSGEKVIATIPCRVSGVFADENQISVNYIGLLDVFVNMSDVIYPTPVDSVRVGDRAVFSVTGTYSEQHGGSVYLADGTYYVVEEGMLTRIYPDISESFTIRVMASDISDNKMTLSLGSVDVRVPIDDIYKILA